MQECLEHLAYSLRVAEAAIHDPRLLRAPWRRPPPRAPCPLEACTAASQAALQATSGAESEGVPEEHASLFKARYPETPCPPYASIYLGSRFIEDHPSVSTLAGILRDLGVEPRERMPLDYIPLVLEAAWLAVEAASETGDLATLREIHRGLLSGALRGLAECIESNSSGYYRRVARLLVSIDECLRELV